MLIGYLKRTKFALSQGGANADLSAALKDKLKKDGRKQKINLRIPRATVISAAMVVRS